MTMNFTRLLAVCLTAAAACAADAPADLSRKLPQLEKLEIFPPAVSLETKRWLLRRAVAERWLLIYEHDATTAWTRVRHDGKAYVTDPD